MTLLNLFLFSIPFIAGNFIYQFFSASPDYLIALERSYFQFALVLFLLFTGWATGNTTK